MNGLELSEQYYLETCKPVIRARFPDYEGRIAAGLVGEGSECFGFDDEYSRDHDWGPAFCLWLTDEDYAAIGKELAAAYEALPETFRGFQRKKEQGLSAGRTGVMPISSFYRKYTGTTEGPQTFGEWARIPERYLATAVNGRIFEDPLGQFTRIRTHLLNYYPEEIRRKKLSVRCAVMGQSGQYNYPRAQKRGNYPSAVLFLADFLRAAGSAVYLLNRVYAPYDKWMHCGISVLPLLGETKELLDRLSMNSVSDPDNPVLIEKICAMILGELQAQGISESPDDFMWNQALHIASRLEDERVRRMDVLRDFV